VDDELASWAAEQAPRLRELAEAEAVKVLRDALVAAALSERDAPTPAPPAVRTPPVGSSAPPPHASVEPPATEVGELLWAYCVMRAGGPEPALPEGIHGSGPVERVEAEGLAVIVSRVPRSEFGAGALQRNLNDMAWLERTAREHEAILDAALLGATIVPLRMCTLYETADNVQGMLARENEALNEALGFLEDRLEWSVKVLVSSDALIEVARVQLGPDDEPPSATERRGEGGAYLLGRRRERLLRQRAQSLAVDLAEQIHARLQDWAIDAVTRPAQNPELSGHEGEMLLNAAYLVERERSSELRRLVDELEAHHRELGISIELTGPWPPYNFVPDRDSRGLA
jgi:hypothetical protein